MTNYTRRSFVRRTGSATLGTALGLGLLPSLTRKLHAADTSTPMGVIAGLTAAKGGDSKVSKTYQVQGGSLTLDIDHQLSQSGCTVAVALRQTYTFKFVITVNGAVCTAEHSWTRTRVWSCVNGQVHLDSDRDTKPSAPTNIVGPSGNVVGSVSLVTVNGGPGATVFISSTATDSFGTGWPAELGCSVSCCAL